MLLCRAIPYIAGLGNEDNVMTPRVLNLHEPVGCVKFIKIAAGGSCFYTSMLAHFKGDCDVVTLLHSLITVTSIPGAIIRMPN